MSRATLTHDQQRVLDEVARLALKGFDAKPSNLAFTLSMPVERVQSALDALEGLGMVLGTEGRTPRLGDRN